MCFKMKNFCSFTAEIFRVKNFIVSVCLCFAGKALDCLYKMGKEYGGKNGKKDSERHMKYLIKSVIKVGILYRNNQLNSEELKTAEMFRKKFQTACMTAISFFEVDFSFDRNFLSQQLMESSALYQQIVRRHLTQKSLDRAESVFQYYGNADFLDSVYKKENRPLLMTLVDCLNKMMDDGVL